MKNDALYPLYIVWLNSELLFGKLSKGQFSLLKISSSKFEDFKVKFGTDELFNSKVIEKYKSDSRDKKIDAIFDEFD